MVTWPYDINQKYREQVFVGYYGNADVVFLRRIQPYLWVASAVAVAYTAWVFTGRLFEHKKLEQRVGRSTPSSPEFDRMYGGDKLRIVQFYARDGEVAPGGKTLLCYGVANATAVWIEPPVGDINPAVNRCVEIAPERTTSYKLTAEGAGGLAQAMSVTVRVRVNRR